MQWLANLSIRRAVFASVLMIAVVAVGILGYANLSVDAFPKIEFPVVMIVTRLDGAAAEEIETQVTDKIEAAVNTIAGIDELRSISSEGVSQVFVTFALEKDIDIAAQDVRDHISTATADLPIDIESPIVQKIDPDAAPILYVSVAGTGSLRDLTELADKRIRRDIENISGVGQVRIVGGRRRQINIWLDSGALQAHNLTGAAVQRAIAGQNLSSPGGTIKTGPRDLTLRVKGRVESPAELGRIIVSTEGGHLVRVADVAQVEDGQEEEETAAMLDETPTLVLSIRKQSGENTVKIVDNVRERIGEIAAGLPAGTKLEVVRDTSGTIRTQVDAVKEHLVLGAIFAIIVVLVFLGNVRSTVIAALSIPVSIIGTFALMWYKGFTLNIITLLALALAVGIVIDDAIVVLENIFRFIDERKMKPFPAAIAATQDIGLAVLATTLSLIAVFLPVAFMSGIVGRFLNSFGLTMAFAIGVSLVVSFTITPMLAARWLDPPDAHKKKSVLERMVDRLYGPVERVYMVMLRWAMSHRWVIVLLCFGALGSCVPLARLVPKGFLPPNDEANFQINVRAPEGTSLQAMRLIGTRIARDTRTLPEVAYTLTTIGDNEAKQPNLASIYVKLTDPKERKASQAELAAQVRRDVLSHQDPSLRIDVSDVDAFNSGQSQKTLQYSIAGPDLSTLDDLARRVTTRMRDVPGAVDVDTNLVLGQPEVRLVVLRDRAADLGVSVADIANAARLEVGGIKVSTYEEGGEDYDIRVRAQADDRTRLDRLGLVNVPTSRGGAVPLNELVTFARERGPSEINRLKRRRSVTVSCNALPGVGESTLQETFQKVFAEEGVPAGYTVSPLGRSKEMGKAGLAFITAFGLSFLFMYLILAAQFESWIHPLTILISLPLTVPFALLSLLIFGQGLNIQSALGLLVLFGVVKKNSVLQVDHTNNLRAAGMARAEAILAANRDRLRPILMTTVAFVAGMAPLVFAKGIGAGFNRATAGIVVGGQAMSLLLTLLATPVVYSLLDDMATWATRRRDKVVDRGRDEVMGPPPAAH